MNYANAKDILGIYDDNITITNIKKKYHQLALQYHPDKNNNSHDSCEKFKLISDAYQFLTSELEANNIPEASESSTRANETENTYNSLLELFIKSMIESHNPHLYNIIKDIVINGCKKISIQVFDKLDKDVSMNILSFISKYKNILHIEQATIDIVRDMILEKFKNDELYILNPTIDDLLEHNIYKLTINNSSFLVPLWHDEVYFDGSGCDIIVQCIPDLPDNIYIDEYKTLHIDIEYPFGISLLDNQQISFQIGKKTFNVDILFKKNQTCYLSNQGISIINENNMYDIETKGGIYVNIVFV